MERRGIVVHGTVQGVGFRPFVYNLALRLQLRGFVANNGGGVHIGIEGDPRQLDRFIAELTGNPPALARIDHWTCERQIPRGDPTFDIRPSTDDAHAEVVISPDVATCQNCLVELFDPQNRRYRYPFLNCTNCGPRLTIVTGAPYDRERTTMAAFGMCAACRAEYNDPADRRFHAQPTACSICGPQLLLMDGLGKSIECDDPLTEFIGAMRRGKIGAMKGLGGYHLVCDARNPAAVACLRARKHRDQKPFAVMVESTKAAESLCELRPEERDLLESIRRPIVLLRKHASASLAEGVAPGNPMLGVMLPYTPLHHLLMHEIKGPLVMTSGNRADEPIATTESEVFERLQGIADLFLTHNRAIHLRCDDSVIRVVGQVESPVRRSRGYAPQPLKLPVECRLPMLAVGGQLKATFALGSRRNVVVSHHLGDLDHFEAYRAFERDVALYEKLFAIRPAVIVHDLHPDYASTRYALRRAAAEGIRMIPVQHHHAHMAGCLAEHGVHAPAIGVCFDGAGYGTDGAVWGGEFLIGDLNSFTRAGHLRYVRMPGAAKAVKEPWRMAVAHLRDAGLDSVALRSRIESPALRTAEQMIAQGFNSPWTSSAGRLFDAVASLLGVRDRVSFEGQAAIELEWLAAESATGERYAFDMVDHAAGTWEVDTRKLIRDIAADVQSLTPPATVARKFHNTMVEVTLHACLRLREMTAINTVALSGGVFMNALLHSHTESHLKKHGFLPLFHRHIPTNDGGISFGQLAVAASQIGESVCA